MMLFFNQLFKPTGRSDVQDFLASTAVLFTKMHFHCKGGSTFTVTQIRTENLVIYEEVRVCLRNFHSIARLKEKSIKTSQRDREHTHHQNITYTRRTNEYTEKYTTQ